MYTAYDYPTFFSLFPKMGPLKSNYSLTIYGERFPQSELLSCRFEQSAAYPATWLNSSVIICKTPHVQVEREVALQVSFNGYDFLNTGLMYASTSAPIFDLFPTYGSDRGGTLVTFAVSHLKSYRPTFCRFGIDSTPTLALWIAPNLFQCVTPNHKMGKVPIFLSPDTFQLHQSSLFYTFYSAPQVHEIFPDYGSTFGGTLVQVTGWGFAQPPASFCKFGGISVQALPSSNNTLLECVTPHVFSSQTVEFGLSVNLVDTLFFSNTFTYISLVVVSFIHPSSGPVTGGTEVTISGLGFANTSHLGCFF